MSGELSARGTLELEVVDNLKGAIADLGSFNEETGFANKSTVALEKSTAKAMATFSGLQNAIDGASTATSRSNRTATDGSKAWQKYTDALSTANAEYRKFRQGQITGEGGGRSVSEMSTEEMASYVATYEAMNANVISDIRERQRAEKTAAAEAEQALDDWSAAARRLEAVQKTRAETESKEANRQQEIRAALEQRAAAEREAADAMERANRLAADRSAISATTQAFGGSVDTRLGHAATGQVASQTTFAGILRAEDLRASTQAGRDYLNLSTELDDSIQSRERSSRQFSQQLRAQMQAEEDATNGLIAQRYALYDVATTYGAISAAMLGASGLTLKAGADFESAFTNVERTAGGSMAGVKDALTDLSTEIPKSFAEISEIATLSNQLGVAEEDIVEFTELVAKFSTVSGMTAEASAQAFGRLSNILGIPIEQAGRMASAIELVGRNSAATDAEIIALAQRLGSTATRAGFTTDQVIGLSGALGSLGVAPERAQGVFETYFNTLNEALAEGGAGMENFATVTGLSTDALQQMVRSGQGYDVFQKFLAGLQAPDSVELTNALDQLGLSGLRANEVVGRIAGNLPLLQRAFNDAARGASENVELDRQYALILDDLNTQLTLLGNALVAFAAAGSGDLIPGLAGTVELLVDLVNGARDFINTPFGAAMGQVVLAVGLATGILFAYRAATALATASSYALVTAQEGLARSGARGGIIGLIGTLRSLSAANVSAAASARGAAANTAAMGPAANIASRGLAVLRAGAAGLMRTLWPLLIIGALVELVFNFGGAMQWLSGVFDVVIDGVLGVHQAFLDWLTFFKQMVPLMGGLIDWMLQVGNGARGVAKDMKAGFGSWADSLPNADVADLSDVTDEYADAAYDAVGASNDWAGGLGDVGDGASGAAEQVRTLVDYANDLASVYERAFDIRFSGEQGFDTIASGWNAIAQAIEDTNLQINEYRADMASLTADKAIREYWLSVAENYGDTLRAGKLRAEISDIDSDLAKKAADLTKAQESNSKTLDGNSDAAIANRAELLGLVGNYQDYIGKLAASGMSSEDLIATTARLKQEFIAQATQLGYSSSVVLKYAAAFDDVTLAINRVPRNITVNANADPALQALNEFMAQAKATIGSGLSVPIGSTFDPAGNAKQGRADYLNAQIASWTNTLRRAIASGADNQGDRALAEIARLQAVLNSGNFYTGGYTGDGGKYEPKGIVHGGEFVFSKAATSRIGVQNLAYAHDMAKSGRSMAPTVAATSGGGGFTDLSASSIQQLANILRDSVQLVIPGVAIAKAVSANNVNSGSRRSA